VSAIDRLVLLAITDLDRFDAQSSLCRLEELAQAAAPGSLAIELRDRSRSVVEMLRFGEKLRAIAADSSQLFVVNDRLDLAVLLDAHGVHLGEGSVATADARTLIGDRFVIRACHRAEACSKLDAEIVLLSPIFEARKGNPPLGIEGLRAAARLLHESGSRTRLFALGGVDVAGAKPCISAGAHGIAAISAIFAKGDGRSLLGELGIERTPP
jgi:thiamine-phosphate pyrophosphorylase